MPLCFAYGANMDAQAMAQRCPRSQALGAARLMRHRFAIMPQGFANVITDPRASVHGVLWHIALADMRALDAFEGVRHQLYRKVIQPVMKAAGGSARAIVYMGEGEGGRAGPQYMADVIAAAKAWGLPPAHVRMLEGFAGGRAVLGGAAMQPESAKPEADAPRHKVTPRFATPFDR